MCDLLPNQMTKVRENLPSRHLSSLRVGSHASEAYISWNNPVEAFVVTGI